MQRVSLFSWQLYTFRNYGDAILAEAIRYLFNSFGQRKYFRVMDGADSRYPIGPSLIDHANKFDAGVIAGGGIIIPRNPATSGWGFNCTTPNIKKLKRTIIFAVGYNLYRNHTELNPIFKENFESLLENTIFTGLRNEGSIEKIKGIVDKKYHSHIYHQPCPTTFIKHLVEELNEKTVPAKQKKIALQISLTKADSDVERVSRNVLLVCRELKRRGYSIDIVSFFSLFDAKIADYLRDNGFNDFTFIEMNTEGRDILSGPRYFSDIPLVVSTRGHGAMVPFGAGSLFVPVNIAPKVVYFAQDCGLGKYIVDVEGEEMDQSILTAIDEFYDKYDDIQRDMQDKRRQYYEMTLENLSRIYYKITGEVTKENECLPLNEFEVFLSTRLHAKCVKLESVTRDPDKKK
ncbi:polysaccharide pyruvyl transferase family protein (plasmid) [Sinorhizobium meliloti]|uniref:polysaccharide pyruvyl transferase family protein n=1 Tax=Rhizobium meliloti TaxID=382 RepID=UPI000C9BF3E1|nr:polysaccharide pyruvyl transferase family protein [Sinorhizobium meliloti]RMI03493.1 polysaccharide pyruvyl transferase family protein [Sinorhizobium meliloti]RMI08024.1 polysaccharide pyruvyl transferase family protein [Sinorhizobium meliloti]RVG03961.1 polysaccharide pyruvyl transferase family protein [Sinorhizobium meliloti]WQO98161.1 polysaccharide pyruvyl transferase family protein [Sinorhizobium meliloti]